MGLDVKRREGGVARRWFRRSGRWRDAALQHADEAVGELMQRGGVDRHRGRGACPKKGTET
jgi:hypothetical protein